MTLPSVPRTTWLSLFCLALVGCGEHPKGDVSGTVSYKAQKIPLGRITLQSQVGRMESFSGQILNGQYEVKGVPVGPAKVSVETYGPSSGSQVKAPPPGLQIRPKDFEAIQSAKKLPIPDHYSNLEKSGLTHEVTAGPHTQDFDLK